MLNLMKHVSVLIISSNKNSFQSRGGANSAGVLNLRSCSFFGVPILAGLVIWHWAVMQSFAVMILKCPNNWPEYKDFLVS